MAIPGSAHWGYTPRIQTPNNFSTKGLIIAVIMHRQGYKKQESPYQAIAEPKVCSPPPTEFNPSESQRTNSLEEISKYKLSAN